ncbi:Copper chaperone SCO1/SenC [Macleaya cordata]|uniref:Copper chaperone SCO1/SenC n=1 Tax=Macleaya cordata TaxID=56857 RepID=A0A200PLN4_MACCD|nr:Copper chaperone SCO1/SenC [Macleaya cordata]
MASIMSRNQHLRCIRRTLFTYTQHHLKTTKPSSPSNQLHSGFSNVFQSRLKPPSQSVTSLTRERYALNLYHRFLCSNPENPKSKNPEEAATEGGEKESESSHQTDQNAGKSVRGAPVSWLSFFLLILTGGGVIYYYDQEKKRHIEDIHTASTAVKQGPSVGTPLIGGPFNLINHDGKPVTNKDFLGKWNLIYFGFTHCPDICPDELQKLAAAIDKIKEKAGIEIVPIFISVDPERDTVEQVHDYVKEFHPNLIGLTGSVDEIRKVARAYRVYYMKTEEEGSDYLVDHSIIMYLMSPNMEFVKYFGKNEDVDSLTNGIIKEVKQYRK